MKLYFAVYKRKYLSDWYIITKIVTMQGYAVLLGEKLRLKTPRQ